MAITFGGSLIKILLFVFNFIWLLLGAAILYLGIRVLLKYTSDISDVIKETPSYAAIILLAAGGVIFLVSFLGCCGAIRENYCMLNIYSVFIFLCIIAQGVGAYFVLRYHYDIDKYAADGIKSAIQAYDWKQPTNDPANRAINEFQRHLKCCGGSGRNDWDLNQQTTDIYPSSCCKSNDTEDGGSTENIGCVSHNTWDKGCVEALKDLLTTTVGSLGFIALAVILVQLLILVSACCLAREIQRYGPYANPKGARA